MKESGPYIPYQAERSIFELDHTRCRFQIVASLAQCGLDALDVGEDRKAVLYMAAAREMMQELELLLVEIDRVLDECRR